MADRSDQFDLEVSIPVPEGLHVTTELPYRVLLVADMAGPEKGAVSGPLDDGVVEVNADTFDAMMAAACPSARFTIADPLAAGSVMVELDLRFDSLRAFDPKNLAQQVPAARAMLATREPLVARMRGRLSAAQITQAVSQAASSDQVLSWLTESMRWSPAAPAAQTGVVEGLLGQIDLGETAPETAANASPPPKTPVGSLVSAAAGQASIPAQEASAIRRTLAELDRRISQWLDTVLHSPPVQAIESAWRSLAFLVSHTEFRKGLRLSVLHAPRPQLADRFRQRLIDPVFDEGADAPDLIVLDYPFGNGAADLEALDELAQHGASLPAVVLAGVAPGFFGVKQAWQVPTLPALISMFDQWQFAKWKTLRGQAYARCLGVVFGRCLLRGPHGRQETADLEFAYREDCVTDKDLAWAGGVIAAATAISQSVADTGWPTGMAGYVHGRVEGFATAQGGPKGDKKFGPTDTEMPQPKIEELAAAGINAVVGLRDHDDAVVWNGLTAARAQRTDHVAFLEVSLPYQLFAARLSVLLLALKPHLSGMSGEQVISSVKAHVCDWLQLEGQPTPEQLSVQTRPAEGAPPGLQLAVTVTPPQRVLPGGIPIVLGYRLS
jgi:type VI secretion system ImpC/EvpB family protein/type VI secretion system ImpB/VipA family protein